MTKQIVVCVLACVLMAGCAQSAAPPQSAPPAAVSQSDAAKPAQAKKEVSEKQETAAETTPKQVLVKPGVFYDQNDAQKDAPQNYLPKLTLDDNKNASFCENLLQGMGYYYGTWVQNDNSIVLTVTATDFSGFAGDDVKQIEFTLKDENTLVLQTQLCSSVNGNLFVHQ